MFQRRRRPIDYHWIAPLGRLKRACSPRLLCILRSGRTLLFQSCRAQLLPPVCQMEVHRPPWVEPKITTTVVSHGDSLWRISRVAYGVGTRYADVYKANRDRIRDPDRIYPGRIFVLPLKAR